MKFKVGDKVRAVKDIFEHTPEYFEIGQIYTIKDYDGSDRPYKIDTGPYCYEDELELVEVAPQKTTNYLNEPQFPVDTPDPLKLLKIKNKKLKIELKNKQSRIDYLEGQVKVYEEFFKKSKESK